MNPRFLWGEARSAAAPLSLFSLSVALAVVALVSLGGLRQNVADSLAQQSRGLIASDLQLRGTHPPAAAILDKLAAFHVEHSRILEMFSMVSHDHQSLLCQLKIVEPSYPWYGTVTLRSGRPLQQVLQPGQVVVQQTLLDRLHLQLGDILRIGSASLQVADVVTQEPDRPLSFFAIGPRVFISSHDLGSLDLIRQGSSVTYRTLIKTADEEAVADALRPLVHQDHDRLQTWQQATSDIQRFFDHLLRFLTGVAVFTLVLAGVSIQSTVSAFLNRQRTTMATLKALGSSQRFITTHYLAIVAAFGCVGLAVGIALGLALQFALPGQVPGLLGSDIRVSIALWPVAVAVAAGLATMGLATWQPLQSLHAVRPLDIFHNASDTERHYRLAAPAILLATLLLAYEIQSWLPALEVAGILLAVMAVVGGAAWVGLRYLRAQDSQALAVRQALRGLQRPGNQSWLVAVNLAVAVTGLLTLLTVEGNLRQDFFLSYPSDSPNLWFVDIQRDELEAFKPALGRNAPYYPVIRARVLSVNGVPVEHDDRREHDRTNLDREVHLTYRTELLDNEQIVGGGPMFSASSDPQVSVEQELAEAQPIHLGDSVLFDIQGVQVAMTVSSIRALSGQGVHPFFEFVVNPPSVADAPVTFFTAVQVAPDQVPALQNRLARQFPNVTSIDVHDALKTLQDRLEELDEIVRVFTALSLGAGLLMLAGSLLATQAGRLREAVYCRILGASSRFVWATVALESSLLGVLAGTLAVVLSQLLAWAACHEGLEIDFQPAWAWSLGTLIALPAAMAMLGLAASVPLLRLKPADYLRHQEAS